MKTSLVNTLVTTTALSLILSACGGGGGGGGVSASHPVDLNGGHTSSGSGSNSSSGSTGSTGTDSGSVSNGSTGGTTQTNNLVARDINDFLNSAEYNRSSIYGGTTGLAQINAAAAYATGASGAGITIGIIDTGIDATNAEFAGAISGNSINIVTGQGGASDLLGINPHGTWVAGTAAARRNGDLTQGVAFGATILAVRADTVDSTCPNGCFQAQDIAHGITYATDHGARVINMSMGAAGSLGQMVTNAAAYAASHNVLLVAAAGNESASEVDAPANLGSVAGSVGSVLAVGAVDANNVITSFSNRAGAAKDYFLVAPGDQILTTDVGGGMALTAGTSFSSPIVAGAAAVLMEYAPYLTAKQVASLLLDTATDLGATGVDAVYGHGLLNLGAALAPAGTTSVPTGTTVTAGGATTQSTNVALGAAFGDALGGNSLLKRGIMVDSYGRAYNYDLSRKVSNATYDSGLAGFLAADTTKTVGGAMRIGGTSASASFTDTDTSMDHAVQDLAATLGKPQGQARMALTTEAAKGVSVSYTYGHSLGEMFGLSEQSNRVAGDTLQTTALDNAFLDLVDGGNAAGTTFKLGAGLALTVGGGMQSASSSFTNATTNSSGDRSGYAVELAWQHKGTKLGVQAGQVDEQNSTLNSSSDGALGFGSNSRTSFVGVNAAVSLMQGLALGATYQMGFTQIASSEGSLIGDFQGVRSDKFAVALMADDVAAKGDRLTLSVSQPVRVASGTAALNVPVGVTATGGIINASQRVNLTPSGQQMDIGAGYAFALEGEQSLGISTVGTLNPGQNAKAGAALAVGVRYSSKF